MKAETKKKKTTKKTTPEIKEKEEKEIVEVQKENDKEEKKAPIKTKEESKKEKKSKEKKTPWLKSVFKELKLVQWPSKKDMVKYSIATIVFIIFFALFFYAIELIMAFLKSLI